jgi:hypothetical protein
MKPRSPEDYFAGAVPAGVIFDMQVHDMRSVARMRPPASDLRDTPFAELCLIGLVAYFEGFCKNHFASIINICPQLLRELQTRGRDISVSAFHLLDAGEPILPKLGYLVSEGYDFGTAKAINGIYCDLLRVTPFSKNEMARFSEILDDRNLIVHHGGIFGPRYARERFIKRETGMSRLFLDSLVVTTDQLETAAAFLHSISMKVRTSTESALTSYVREHRLKLSRGARDAVEALAWADGQEPAN